MSVQVTNDAPAAAGAAEAPALEVVGLTMDLPTPNGPVRVLDDVSFSIARGRVRGLIGESGSGKSMTALSIVGLLPPGADVVSGSIRVAGTEVVGASKARLRALRGAKVGFVFQDPMTTLNPVLPIGFQIKESLRAHRISTGRAADARAIELLDMMGIPNARARLRQYPHEFSGGMRQRIVIALALACEPALILADEPTTALDVTIQSQILDLIQRLVAETDVACLWITHDLGVAASLCDDISVMYAGQVVESGPVEPIFANPRMPYTRGLMEALPRIDTERSGRLPAMPGSPPLPSSVSRIQCAFAERCAFTRRVCEERAPALTPRHGGVTAARCFATEDGGWLDGRSLSRTHS
ncbi:ABC transporter ATP-binding protein [Leucobacter sp. wl10]|uniref:ABC transporter ATP-binding protein n=1 Tax=Leucobacter sp. wl10 TaxID=2304677 RepID=UPI000E5BBB84|nr:ABC transporter ATP-binding protein [Leucobacter sp. wl10]RGE20048.1 ABC transporter ATP-binding protein [Leucobacter sp. wl10]